MIQSLKDYQELASMADTAQECIESLRFGSHYLLIKKLKEEYGIVTDRMGAIKKARQLCDEFIQAQTITE